jgi:hypothetical protein
MNQREKILAIIIGAFVALFALSFGLKAFFTKPLQEMDRKTALLRERLEKSHAERRAFFNAEDQVKRVAERTFSDQIDQASARSGEMITQQIIRSGLREADFSRMPVGPRKLRGASEIGWNIQGHGPLPDVINFIFLLQESPCVHRLENLTLSSGDAQGHVRVGLRFLTLVITPAPIFEPVALEHNAALDSPERRLFDGIVARDILRPYIKQPPAPATPAPKPAPTAPPPPGPESFRVVSLSDWMGQPEIHVRDLTKQKTISYKPGDELAGGAIVMVDYRPLPMPGNEALQSFSRVIIKLGADYWAIERGKTLADKYKLAPSQLPEHLHHPQP